MRKKYFKRIDDAAKGGKVVREAKVVEMIPNTEKTIAKGELLFDELNSVLFAAEPSISGAVAMNYAVSRLYVAMKMAMREIGIDVEPYFKNMVNFWESIED